MVAKKWSQLPFAYFHLFCGFCFLVCLRQAPISSYYAGFAAIVRPTFLAYEWQLSRKLHALWVLPIKGIIFSPHPSTMPVSLATISNFVRTLGILLFDIFFRDPPRIDLFSHFHCVYFPLLFVVYLSRHSYPCRCY